MTCGLGQAKKKDSKLLELPEELSNAAWLVEDGVMTAKGRHWKFHKGGVYQIGQGSSQHALLVYLRDEGIHHVFQSYRAEWITTYTNQQLYGMEVLRMTENMKSCPHCGGRVLKTEVVKDTTGWDGCFTGTVSCQDKNCGAVTSWHLIVFGTFPKEEKSAKQEAAAKELLIDAWNKRGQNGVK